MIDLFKEIVPEEKQHPNFIYVKRDKYLINILNEWCKHFVDRDGKFTKEFQTTFNSSFWELYCFAVLKQMNMEIDFRHDRPDFVLDYKNIKFNIECVVANNAEKDIPEYDLNEKLSPNTSLEERVYNQTLRLINSIDSKNKLYLKNYGNLDYVKGNPFIVALAPFDQPCFMDVALEAIHMVLYGINVDKKSFEELHFDKVHKNENVSLDMGMFTNKNYENISGILFSNVATMGKVRAISDYPNIMFYQIRYNERSKKPLICLNYRVDESKTLLSRNYKKEFKQTAQLFKKEIDHRKYSCRQPFLEEGYKETLTDGLHLYLNPYAQNPISEEILNLFKLNGIQIHTFDTNEYTMQDIHITNEHLIQRMVRGYM